LLGVLKALLNGRHCAQVTPHDQHRALGPQAQGGVCHRDVGTQATTVVVDLALFGQTTLPDVGQQQFNLAAGFAGDGFNPSLTDPVCCRRGNGCARVLHHAGDDALVIDEQRNVAGQRNKRLCQLVGAAQKGARVIRH
jgi:hypothetical protein